MSCRASWAAFIVGLKSPKMDRLEPRRSLKSALRTPCVPVAVITSSHETQAVVRRRRLRVDSAIMKSADWALCSMVMHRLGFSWRWLNHPSRQKPALCASTGSMVRRSSRGTPAVSGLYSLGEAQGDLASLSARS
jgi:DNA-binding NarL/FixJ family response regulator